MTRLLALYARRAAETPIAAIRPYLAIKATLLLLAFDMWVTRASHAGRYGAGGFNVAHWPWLDALQPEIAPPMYVGACVLTGALCFAIAFAHRPPRWLLGLTFLVHTWSWAMSMLDSYQHHYLLSIVLFAMIFLPQLSAEEALRLTRDRPDTAPGPEKKAERAGKSARSGKKRKKKKKAEPEAPKRAKESKPRHPLLAPYPFVHAWAWTLLAGSTAIVYAYTAFSKTDPEWLSGASLRSVIHFPSVAPSEEANVVIRLFWNIIEWLGPEHAETFWFVMGHSVVLVQIVVMAGYALSPWRDRLRGAAAEIFFGVALFTALSFHFGAELMGLQIGWFSYYMIAYALIFFLPGPWLVAMARAVLWPTREDYGVQAVLLRLGLVLAAGAAGYELDEPILYGFAALIAAGSFLRVLSRATFAKRFDDLPAEIPLGLAGIAGLTFGAVGWFADVPGAREAAVIAAVLLGGGVVAALFVEGHARALHGYSFGLLLGAVSLLVVVLASDLRWDYWRNVGGDHRRRHEWAEAVIAYEKANEYAPLDEDGNRENRDSQLAECRRELERAREAAP